VSVSSALWTPAYVALGSNLDEPLMQIAAAFDALGVLPSCRLLARSALYRSEPLGPQPQPEFVNAAAGLLTQLAPRALLDALKGVEAQMGRAHPVQRWGPRRIDLDLLVYGDAQIAEEHLTIPHPGVPSRNFVLYPLRDIAPTLLVPGHGRVSALAARAGSAGLAVIA
jgi:2-amino-4-hydroxy-6-hydroxymethyldihydropteridine diphosphokinase